MYSIDVSMNLICKWIINKADNKQRYPSDSFLRKTNKQYHSSLHEKKLLDNSFCTNQIFLKKYLLLKMTDVAKLLMLLQ